ncbi:MAG: hypothetical protein OEW23_04065 [Candidatus Aminicenantes bacterium]|nr:hypothetical protein [Candidatus Aminicenantes bacterium]
MKNKTQHVYHIMKHKDLKGIMKHLRCANLLALIIFACLTVFHLYLPAQEKDEESALAPRHYTFNLSLWYPVSINKTQHDSVNINLTLLYGRVGTVRGLDLAIGASALEHGLEGFQLAGFFGVSGDYVSGAQVSGLINVCGENLKGGQVGGLINIIGSKGQGFQIAGGLNISGDSLHGFQASGLFNIVGERFQGLQATGGFNIVGESCVGYQGAGLFNIVGEDFTGLQTSGLFNIVGENLTGAQIGVVNVAPYFSDAAQIGIFNVSDEMRGFQLGVVNWNDETFGIPVGLVNVSKKEGRIRWISWGSNISSINSGVKFEVDKIYSIVSLGYYNYYLSKGTALSYAGYYGVYLFQDSSSFSIDLGYMYMDNKKIFKSNPEESDQHIILTRAVMSIAISSRVSLIGGGGLSYIVDRHRSIDRGEVYPIFFFGVEVL